MGAPRTLTCAGRPRCTLQQDCANASQPHFWTSASAGPGRCPAMTVLPAEIDVHQEYPVSPGGQDPSSRLRGAGGEQPFPWHPDRTGGASWVRCPRDLEADGESSAWVLVTSPSYRWGN